MSRIATPREGQTFIGPGRLAAYASFVKLPHTVFALPFALTGVVFASRHTQVTAAIVGWAMLAFTSVRFAAMAFNRIVDREIDARNPRTAMREIPSGRLGVREATVLAAAASAIFLLSAWMLNPLCFALAPIALAWVLGYSYSKRFTQWAHLVLGAGLAIAPVGGYLAVTGRWAEPWWMLIALAAAVGTWVAGFDILYALQDEEFDRTNGLHSLPAALGGSRAIVVSRALHVATVLCLALAGIGAGVDMWYWGGVVATAALLVYEHSLVRADDLSRLDAAFFTMNGVISLTFFAFVLVDRVLR